MSKSEGSLKSKSEGSFWDLEYFSNFFMSEGSFWDLEYFSNFSCLRAVSKASLRAVSRT